jgi:ABC-type branched-subunit amino acid transport system ATPase component
MTSACGSGEGSSQHILEVRNLTRSFGGVRAVAGMSLGLSRGKITGLIGPNGAGKSTTLGMIAGAIKPTSGMVLLDGADVTGLPSYKIARRGVGRTFQVSSEFPSMTVLENMLTAVQPQRGDSLGQALLGRWYWRKSVAALLERATGLLGQFDMTHMANELAATLSGGQRRLLEIMRVLMADPRILLLDEPMAGVNPSLTRRIETHLLELKGQGLSMLIVEHEMAVIERLCDHVIVMAQGAELAQGTMGAIRADQSVLDAYLTG